MAYVLATIAMVITLIASMFTLLMLGWVLVYGDDGPNTIALTIEIVIASSLALLAFFVVCKGYKNVRARFMAGNSPGPRQ